jgi:hypothetical protein
MQSGNGIVDSPPEATPDTLDDRSELEPQGFLVLLAYRLGLDRYRYPWISWLNRTQKGSCGQVI